MDHSHDWHQHLVKISISFTGTLYEYLPSLLREKNLGQSEWASGLDPNIRYSFVGKPFALKFWYSDLCFLFYPPGLEKCIKHTKPFGEKKKKNNVIVGVCASPALVEKWHVKKKLHVSECVSPFSLLNIHRWLLPKLKMVFGTALLTTGMET